MTPVQAEKLITALREPDSAFRAVPNTVRQGAADIVADLATAIRALAARLIRKEEEAALTTEALKQERGEIAYLFEMQAIDHENLAEESARNEERDDEDSHRLEASVWRSAARAVSARNSPPTAAPTKPAEAIDDDIAF